MEDSLSWRNKKYLHSVRLSTLENTKIPFEASPLPTHSQSATHPFEDACHKCKLHFLENHTFPLFGVSGTFDTFVMIEEQHT